jgi:hypothetical protein
MSEDVKIPGMTPPTCPKCHSAVKPISVWRMFTTNSHGTASGYLELHQSAVFA